jgi:hypothetical protein
MNKKKKKKRIEEIEGVVDVVIMRMRFGWLRELI